MSHSWSGALAALGAPCALLIGCLRPELCDGHPDIQWCQKIFAESVGVGGNAGVAEGGTTGVAGAGGKTNEGNGGSGSSAGGGDGGAPPACDDVEQGWKRIGYVAKSDECPTGFTLEDFKAEPEGAVTCDCGPCVLETKPTCDAGEIQWFYTDEKYSGAKCDKNLTELPDASPGVCTSAGSTKKVPQKLRAVPPTPKGGTCTRSGEPNINSSDWTGGLLCRPVTASDDELCALEIIQCVEHDGIMDKCPTGFSNPQVIGKPEDFTCDCGCSIEANCEGYVNHYAELKVVNGVDTCNDYVIQVPINDTCKAFPDGPNGVVGDWFSAYEYLLNGKPTCTNDEPGIASFTKSRTLCCKDAAPIP